jgi:eukaryotic-like serine/threonine-protein kinase
MVRLGDTLVGRYRIDARIGTGGFATVFRARDLRLEREVAVKVVLPEQATDADVVARFDREARALATFSHPNVVAIHDVEPATPSVGDVSFLVMDLCEGGSLAERYAASETRGLTPEILVPILVDVARGLAALHAAGVIHRDVKPSNVLLTGGRALIADLGIAVATTFDATAARDAIGTLPYLAPEQLAGASATFASDVHALGVVAYLGFTGRLPRAAGSFEALVEAGTRPVPSISSLAPDLGTPFDRPVAAALANDPAARPSVDRFAARLEGALDRWREIGASRMTSLAVTPVVVAAAAAMPSAAAESHDARDPMASSPKPDDPTVVDPSMPATTRFEDRATPSPASPGVYQPRHEAVVRDARPGWRVIGAFVIGLAVITASSWSWPHLLRTLPGTRAPRTRVPAPFIRPLRRRPRVRPRRQEPPNRRRRRGERRRPIHPPRPAKRAGRCALPSRPLEVTPDSTAARRRRWTNRLISSIER